MTKCLLLTIFVAVALSQPIEVSEAELAQWEIFKVTYGKEYTTEKEEQDRKLIFVDNLKFVREHNDMFEKGEVTFDMELNKFADLTAQEIEVMVSCYKKPEGLERNKDVFNDSEDINLPTSVDWREEGAVTRVKDQGHCGSCWAFSTTGTLEGLMFLKTKKLVSLSEQNLVDCSRAEGNAGCSGGWPNQAFDYIQLNRGIDTEEFYPYEGVDGKCRYKPKGKGAKISGHVHIPSGSEEALQKAVAIVGPISVAINSNHKSFHFYKSGVYVQPNCSTTTFDHAMLVVGYGTVEKGGDFWLVKNSWSKLWGMKGYILMARNNHNMCGIATHANYPKV